MQSYNKANPCRPGFGASCSFCCGSHNFKLSREELEELFIERGLKSGKRDLIHQEESSHVKIADEGMQCVHMGIADSEHGMISCLTYFEDHHESKMDDFFHKTCKTYLCEAWRELDDREILFAAELMGDWYYYSILLNSPDILLDLTAEYGNPQDVPEDVLLDLKEELTDRISEIL